MKKIRPSQRALAWLLIAALSHPFGAANAQVPPNGVGDFTIYTATAATGASAPNILLIADTSDSMNIPEGWREYPGDYDSHVEYLWNDLSRIVDADAGSNGEVVAENSEKISTSVIDGVPTSPWGFWSGNTLEDRQALWQAARASAKATEAGDPGARSIYRNYRDLSWIYWLPAGTAETDARLRSVSWNRFRGHVQVVGGKRGGINFGATANDYQDRNQCGASLSMLTPSTVFAPSSAAANPGKFLGQQWVRWEPWLNLATVANGSYPGSSATSNALASLITYAGGYLDTSAVPAGNPTNNPVYRDSYPGTSPIGAKGLPIRIAGPNSGAGWSELKADLGGFNFQAAIDSYNDLALLNQVKSWYGLATTSDVDGSGAADIADARFIAWRGNRDGSPAFGAATGVHGYIDSTPAACDALTGPESATCLRKPGAVTADVTVTKTAACSLTGQSSEGDALNQNNIWGGSCQATVTCTDPNGPGVAPDCANVPDPVCPAPAGNDNIFYDWAVGGCAFGDGSTLNVQNCSLQNVQTLNVPQCKVQNEQLTSIAQCTLSQETVNVAACALQGANPITVAACQPTGGTPVSVATCQPEAAGTVSIGACAATGGGSVSVAACAFTGRQSYTVGSCQWKKRSAHHIEGPGWYAYGGTCEENGSTANCVASGGNLGGRTYTNDNGGAYFGGPQEAIASTGGCSNIIPAGTVYNYGGSCQENSDSASCQVTGGITATIGGVTYTNVNGTCGNKPDALPGTYTFGITCKENNSEASCNTSAGISKTIRGMTYNGIGATCSNKPATPPGTYSYGIVCKENGAADSCGTTAGNSMMIRGQAYPGVGATCSNVIAAGTYYSGVTCKESGSEANCATSAGGSMTIRGQTYNNMGSTCSNTVAPGTYTVGGTCQENGSPLSCGTSTGTDMAIGGVPRTGVNRTCSQVLAVGSYGVNGSCSAGAPICVFNPGDSISIRGTNYSGYGASCSNAADATAGTIKHGGTGCYTDTGALVANCDYKPGENKVIGGVPYLNVGATCTNIVAAGNYSYGGDSCAGTAGNCTYNGGSDFTVGGNTYQHRGASCANIVGAGAYTYGRNCLGTLYEAAAAPTPGSSRTTTNNTAAACTLSGQSDLIVGGVNYGKTGGTCVNRNPASNNQTCIARYGAACLPAGYTCGPAASTSYTGGGSTAADQYFRVYNLTAKQDYLVHDCKADEPTLNPGGDSYLRGAIPLRTLGTAFNTTSLADDATAAYTTNSGQTVPADDGRKIDLYSVNYLNWKFGPKGPNGHPIGRKTRLQIAKDALSALVAQTNGVRFGLMVFNKTTPAAAPYNFANDGGNIAYKVTDMGPKNCSLASATTTGSMDAGSTTLTVASNPGFGSGNAITVPGAAAGGAALSASIVNIDGNTITLSAAAATTVANVSITVPACNADEAAAYANRVLLTQSINGLTAASRTPLTESLYEAYLYFRGEAPLFGRSTTPAAVGGAVSAGCDKTAFATPGTEADCTGSSGNYVSPMMSSIDPNTGQPASCSKNFVIMMTDGGPEEDVASNDEIKALTYVESEGADPVVTMQTTASKQFETGEAPYGPVDPENSATDGGYVWLDEMAHYMAKADMNASIAGRQPVNTYTIGFAGANSPVLSNTAEKGEGNYYVAQDAAALSQALTESVAAIQKWNATMAAPTIPASALNRREAGGEVYLSFFAPGSSQAWQGTLKKFLLGKRAEQCGTSADGTEIELCYIGKTVLSGSTVKNINQVTTDPTTGETTTTVNPNAVSFWNSTDIVDGAAPNKGGSGQMLLSNTSVNPSTRKLYTYISDPGSADDPVSASMNLYDSGNAVSEASTLLTKTRLGNPSMSNAARATLINFIRGGDPGIAACSDADPETACTAWRGWPHADILHGSPAAITYDPTKVTDSESGAAVATKQYLYYFSNDGLLHAINARDGKEAWAFLAAETLPQLHAIKANLAGQHLTMADGDPMVWLHDANSDGKIVAANGDKAYLYFGLRRGGRAYYALDVTDPASPKLLWKIERRSAGAKLCTSSGCADAAAFDELGYTWSAPIPVRIAHVSDAGVPAVIFAGGYDPNQDNFTASAADTMGRAVYVVNGATGALIKAFKNGASGAVGGGEISGMDFSIASHVAALNTDLDGQRLADRLYVGDMAANLWRFDIGHPDTAKWTAKKLATLSSSFSLPGTVPNRKVLAPPAVVKQHYLTQRYDAVYVGTGDREHPLVKTSQDMLFMVKDFDVGLSASAGDPVAFANFYNITEILTEAALDGAAFKTKPGWYLALPAGEKVFGSPSVLSNVLRFSTYNPGVAVSACVAPGRGMMYAMDARFGGLPPGFTMPAGQLTAAAAIALRQWAPGGTGSGQANPGGDPDGGGEAGGPSGGRFVIEDKNIFWCSSPSGCSKIGSIGGASKIYWYRETAK